MSKVLVLRTCKADMMSHNGFVWPESGPVACADWRSVAACGNGLHGLLWGEGDGSLLDWGETAKWLVVAVEGSGIVDLKGKVKFPSGEVVFCGDRIGATSYIRENGGAGKVIHGGTATAGDSGTVVIRWYSEKTQRWRLAVGEIGEGGLVANTPYRVKDGKLVKAEGGAA